MHTHMPIHMTIHMSIHMPIHMPIHLPIEHSMHMSTHMYIHTCIHMPMHISIHVSKIERGPKTAIESALDERDANWAKVSHTFNATRRRGIHLLKLRHPRGSLAHMGEWHSEQFASHSAHLLITVCTA